MMVRMPRARASRIRSSASVEVAEERVDGAVVGDVVAAVGHRRGVPGGEPDGVDAEVAQVGQAGADAGEVAGAVAVRVGEAARVDLVDGGAAPPVVAGAVGHRQRPGSGSWAAFVGCRSVLTRAGLGFRAVVVVTR